MAAQDLQIQPRRGGYLAHPPATAHQVLPVEEPVSDRPSVLISAFRRRWWAFLIVAAISFFVAREAMNHFGKDTSRTTAALLHTGLPDSPTGGEVIKPMAPLTCAELIKSAHVIEKLCDKRGLDLSPKIMQELITTQTTRGSSLLGVEFIWSNARDGVAILNDWLEVFVEEVADQRRQTLRNHMKHVEDSLFEARAEVADARQQILEVQAEQQRQLEEGGLNSERYRSVLSNVANTQLSVDEKRVEELGIQEQIDVLSRKSDAIESQIQQLILDYQSQLTGKLTARLQRVREQLTTTSPIYVQISDLMTQIEDFPVEVAAPMDLQAWQNGLSELVMDTSLPLPAEEQAALNAVFDEQLEVFASQVKQFEDERIAVDKRREALQLSTIPLKNQIKLFETRLVEYQQEADQIGEQLTGIGADQFGAYELRLEQAEGHQKALNSQLNAMRQLEQCRVNEWTVSVPASLDTTQVSSNGLKIFVLAFGVCGLVLSSPVLLSEWSRQQTPPQVAFANSLHLPVLAERILQDFAPHRRQRMIPAKLTDEQLEVVRMLALRIQQSAHSPGSVVLFSSIDSGYSPAPLMASIAECLSQREERVLIVDAICPSKSRLPITNVIPTPEPTDVGSESNKDLTKEANEQLGLSDYFVGTAHELDELIRPTSCPGIDLISSGKSPFPREALASSSLTGLVERCRENYTMILINSPAVTASADLQMLAARADGIVLMATKAVRKNPRARAAVADLIDLGAPIIGVVA